MNEKKVAFIICTNSDLWFAECAKYINNLEIPKEFQKEIVKIVGAVGMAAGYNEGMNKTDAKYKVYLHHDVFIYRKDFLLRMLNIFQSNAGIGMLGLLGSDSYVKGAEYWSAWNLGQVLGCMGSSTVLVRASQRREGEVATAVAVDGMLIMTQYDVRWRDDVFKKWDFYDISQSFEFQRKGYEVGVILEKGEECSILHDCGHSKLWNYDEWRIKFCEEYAEFGFETDGNYIDNAKEHSVLLTQFLTTINEFMQSEPEQAGALVDQGIAIWPKDNDLIMLKNIFEIYKIEKDNLCRDCFLQKGDTYEILAPKYLKYKFLLREVEYDVDENALIVLYEDLKTEKVSIYALEYIVLHSCWNVEKVEQRLLDLYSLI